MPKKKKKRLSSRQTLLKFIEDFKSFDRQDGYFRPVYPFEDVMTDTFVAPIKIREAKMVELEQYLLGAVSVSQPKVVSAFMHDFEITTANGILICRCITEYAPFKPDLKGTWGVNPMSFRLKAPKEK